MATLTPAEIALFLLAGTGAGVLGAFTARHTIGRLVWWYYQRRTSS